MEDEPTGVITFGPKEHFLCCVQICYTPTKEQIKNMNEFFGWDYVTNEELKEINNGG